MTKKSWCPNPSPLDYLETGVLLKWKNSKNFSVTKKMLVPRHPLWKIQSPQCFVIKKFLKNFDLKFSMTKKI